MAAQNRDISAYKTVEAEICTYKRSLGLSDFPTEGSWTYFQDEDGISATQQFKPDEGHGFDALTKQLQDMNHSSWRTMVFYFDEDLRTHFFNLYEFCRDRPLPANTTRIDAVRAEDQAAHDATAISPLKEPLLREVLLHIAMYIYCLPPLSTPEHNDLIKFLAEAGSPPDVACTKPLRDEINTGGAGGPFLRPDVEAALLRCGWRAPSRRDAIIVSDAREEELDGARELFQALLDAHFFVCEPELNQEAVDVLVDTAMHGSVPLMEFVLSQVPLAKLSRFKRAQLLPGVVSRQRKDIRIVEFWLDRGLDPNVVAFWSYQSYAGTGTMKNAAIHCAITDGHADLVQLLLDREAEMVRDGLGRTPLERARFHQNEGLVKLLEEHLQRRGLPLDHFDEPAADDSAREGIDAS